MTVGPPALADAVRIASHRGCALAPQSLRFVDLDASNCSRKQSEKCHLNERLIEFMWFVASIAKKYLPLVEEEVERKVVSSGATISRLKEAAAPGRPVANGVTIYDRSEVTVAAHTPPTRIRIPVPKALDAWQDTYALSHHVDAARRQGKVRLALSPLLNQWWVVPLRHCSRSHHFCDSSGDSFSQFSSSSSITGVRSRPVGALKGVSRFLKRTQCRLLRALWAPSARWAIEGENLD